MSTCAPPHFSRPSYITHYIVKKMGLRDEGALDSTKLHTCTSYLLHAQKSIEVAILFDKLKPTISVDFKQ